MADVIEPVSPFRDNILEGKIALVTGGSSGIGLRIAQELGRHGASVVVMGRRAQPLAAAVRLLEDDGIPATSCQGDVRRPADCEAAVATAVDKFGGLSVVVNSAAGNFLCAAEDLSYNGFKTVLDIDSNGTFNVTRAAFDALCDAEGAVVINISATLHYGARHYQLAASAAKAAIDSMTRTLGLEWGEYGIRAVGIAPGPIAGTAGMAKLAGPVPADDLNALMKDFIPAGRIGTKADVALMAVYLASDAAVWITGETVVVDGGAWLNRGRRIPKEMVREFSRKVEKKSRSTGLAASGVQGTKIKSRL